MLRGPFFFSFLFNLSSRPLNPLYDFHQSALELLEFDTRFEYVSMNLRLSPSHHTAIVGRAVKNTIPSNPPV